MKKKFNINKIWVYIFLLFISLIPLISISKSLIIALILFITILFLAFKIKIPKFTFLIFILSFLLRLIIVLTLKTPPESDFEILYNASLSILNKDYSFVNTFYFSLWSYQIGFVYIQSLFLRLFNSIIFLKIINCLLSSSTVVLIYLIAKEFTNELSAKSSAIIYGLLPFTLTYVTILTNQYLSSFLIYLGIYILISNKIKIKTTMKYVITAVLLAIANIIRPESIIPLFSIILFLILTINKKNIKINILNILTTLTTYFCITFLITTLLTSTNIAPNGLKNNDPYWKFVLGFNHETAGSYSDSDVAILNNNVKELEIIKERIFTSPLKLAKLFYRKIETFWLNTNMDWSFSYLKDKSINILGITLSITNIVNILANLNNKIMLILYIFLIFGVYKYINKKNYNKNIIILINQVFVTFGVYLLIEVQPRYSYHIAINVAILASLGITEAINLIKKYQKNNGGKRNDKSNDNIWNKTRSNKNGSTC